MPIDPYAPCPGGVAKKIKFCCSDLGGELEKVERMLQGNQLKACLAHIEQLQERFPDRACLMALESLVLHRLERYDETVACTARFLEAHPDNPIALADAAFFAAEDTEKLPFDAVKLICRAITVSGQSVHLRVYQNLGLLVNHLLEEYPLAARSLALLQSSMNREAEEPKELLSTLYGSADFSLILKDDRPLDPCPDDVPWKDRFDKAIMPSSDEGWVDAIEHLSALAEEVDDSPAIWRNLGMLRAWLADSPGSILAMQKLASLDIPFDDAVEAEAFALLLSKDPLGDHVDINLLTYPVEDPDTLMERLTSAPRVGSIQTEFEPLADGTPPPRMTCAFLNRAPSDADELTTLEAIPQVLARAIFFGHQTDRPARFEVVGVTPDDLEAVKTLVDEICDGALGSEVDIEVLERVSILQALFSKSWQLSDNASREKFAELTQQYVEDLLIKEWPRLPLGCLDGKTPQEASQDNALRIRVSATLMVLELFLQRIGISFDVDRLRSLLELPLPEPIDPTDYESQHISLARLHRLMTDKLSDEALIGAFERATVFNVEAAIPQLAKAIVERPSFQETEERLRALHILATRAMTPEQGMRYLEEGKRLTVASGKSCAAWDLLEIRFLLQQANVNGFFDMLGHFREHHMEEPGVEKALVQLLHHLGVLRPDGSLAIPEPTPESSAPSIVVPGQEEVESGKVWTPDGPDNGGEKSKLWTPGSD